MLKQYGLTDLALNKDHILSYTLRHVWGKPIEQEIDYSFHPYGGWIHIDRTKFDNELLNKANDNGVLVLENKPKLSITNVGCEININDKKISADFIVDATGRNSSIARLFGCRRRHFDKLIALVGILQIPDKSSTDPSILIEPFDQGWWFSALLPDNKFIASVFTDSDLCTTDLRLRKSVWNIFLLRAPKTRKRIQNFKFASVHIASANSSILSSLHGARWLCVGDTSCTFDPLSSNGIVNAIETGNVAADAINDYLSNDKSSIHIYENNQIEKFREYMNERDSYYSAERRWRDYPFWARRQSKYGLTNFDIT